MTIYRQIVRYKGFLFLLVLAVITIMFFYTDKVIKNLRAESRKIIELHAHFIADFAENEINSEMNYLFDRIIKQIDFPIIITDVNGDPLFWKSIGVDENARDENVLKKVKGIVKKMSSEEDPIPIKINEAVNNYIHYSDSQLIRSLSYLPYLQIMAMILFVLIGYVGFINIQRSEQRSTWVGMAKETAHQLGTPLSSLMGWTELLKGKVPPGSISTIEEMQTDIDRLAKVSHRFSQIGFATDFKNQPIEPIIESIIQYFKRRLPHMSREIVIDKCIDPVPDIPLNQQLFEWALENLVKNAIDAVEKEKGLIKIYAFPENSGKSVVIEVSDNGKGIAKKQRADVFNPGYTTKKRGWGMGLSLVKRIIQDYHKGKVFVKDSIPGEGTTFRIVLPVKK